MSHEATCWAIRQRGLKPTTRIVLWHLADRHNPDFGCFPSQERLAEDAEISRSTLNEHLTILEDRGLIRREARVNGRTKRQMSTRYILAFERDFRQDDGLPSPETGHGTEMEHRGNPSPEIGHGAVSGKSAEPCPENGESRVRISDTNLVREPLREPVKSSSSSARDAQVAEKPISEGLIPRLTHALGFDLHGQVPKYWITPEAGMIVSRWRTDLGLTDDEIVTVAEGSARAHGSPAKGPKVLNDAMCRYAAEKQAPPLTPIEGGISYAQRHPSRADQRAAAADDAFAERVSFAARNRSPTRSDFGFS